MGEEVNTIIWLLHEENNHIYDHILDIFYAEYNAYPKDPTLVKYLNDLGYSCTIIETDDGVGLEMNEEDATAFILKWG